MSTTTYHLRAELCAANGFASHGPTTTLGARPATTPLRPLRALLGSSSTSGRLRRQLRRSLRSGRPLVLGSAQCPLDLTVEAWAPLLVEQLAGTRGLDLRLTVSALHPDRDPRILARLDEEHDVTVDVVVGLPGRTDSASAAAAGDALAADAALAAAAALVEHGITTRVVTPLAAGFDPAAYDGPLAEIARVARATGADDWYAVDSAARPMSFRRGPEPLWRREVRRLRLEMGLPRAAVGRC